MSQIRRLAVLGALVVSLGACGEADEPGGGANASAANAASNESTANNGGGNVGVNNTTIGNGATNVDPQNVSPNNVSPNNTAPNNSTPNNTSPNSSTLECDYEAVDGVITIEAENLPLNEMWEVGSDVADYQGTGYAFWSGESHNNDPTHGVMSIRVRISDPGRYQLHWRAMIGMGNDTTEHNDMWIRFPDAADYYGLKGEEGAEIRRYNKPACEDADFMAQIVALPDVSEATCAEGSTRDGWMKVYGAGQEWRWAGKTSDNDASDVTAEFPQAGVYTIEFAARADFFLLDTIVFHLESIRARDARGLAETPCQ